MKHVYIGKLEMYITWRAKDNEYMLRKNNCFQISKPAAMGLLHLNNSKYSALDI